MVDNQVVYPGAAWDPVMAQSHARSSNIVASWVTQNMHGVILKIRVNKAQNNKCKLTVEYF